jgi:hypothetical protein
MKSTQRFTKDQEFPDFITDLTSRSLRHIIHTKLPDEKMATRTDKAMKEDVPGNFTTLKADRR